MKRLVIPAGAAVLAGAAVATVPAIADAQAPTAAHTRAYEHAYHAVAHQLGARVPGRNIIEDGTATGAASGPLPDAALDGRGLRLLADDAGRPGCLRAGHL